MVDITGNWHENQIPLCKWIDTGSHDVKLELEPNKGNNFVGRNINPGHLLDDGHNQGPMVIIDRLGQGVALPGRETEGSEVKVEKGNINRYICFTFRYRPQAPE